jgi:hypothetical protein
VEHASPDLYQPRLSRWGHAWRLLAMLALSTLTCLTPLPAAWRIDHLLVVVDVVLGATA